MGCKVSKQIKEPIVVQTCYYFEDLSNELIYELFDYLSYHDIYLSFNLLNNRFQTLIDTYSHYLNLQQHKNNNQLLLRYIHSLKISAKYQLSFIDLSTINSLRGLILSNLGTVCLIHTLDIIALNELEYVYLGACANYESCERQQLGEVQKRILSLGEYKLKKCVFRTRLYADIDQLPLELPSLEYLRIDGCENRLIVNNLLNRMANLKFLRVAILDPIKSDDQYIKQNKKHSCLRNLIIHMHEFITLHELIPLFQQNGLNIKHLIIYSDSIREDRVNQKVPCIHKHFINLYSAVTTIINEFLPKLTNFHLRQSYDLSPYVEEIPSTSEHESYRVSIAPHLLILWQKRD